jgi:hypothetical protein
MTTFKLIQYPDNTFAIIDSTNKINTKYNKIPTNNIIEYPEDIFEKEIISLNVKCELIITKNDMISFLKYIEEFINTFIDDVKIKNKLINKDLFKKFHKLFNDFKINIIHALITNIIQYYSDESDDTNYEYTNYDLTNYTINDLVNEINNINSQSNNIAKQLLENADPGDYYILHIYIILGRLLLDLNKIIQGNKFILVYIPIKYIKLFIYKIHFRNNCRLKNDKDIPKIVEKELHLICVDSIKITNNNMISFLNYIAKYIYKFINTSIINTYYPTNNDNDLFEKLYTLLEQFINEIKENLDEKLKEKMKEKIKERYGNIYNQDEMNELINEYYELLNKKDNIEKSGCFAFISKYGSALRCSDKKDKEKEKEKEIEKEIDNYTKITNEIFEEVMNEPYINEDNSDYKDKYDVLVSEVKKIYMQLYFNKNIASLYILHNAIILRRLLLDLFNLIEKKQFTLEYIPFNYMKLFIYKIHLRPKCLKHGGKNKKYKKTNNKITVIFEKKKYTRTIHMNERKKYVKINKTFILLSKLKKI